MAFIVEEQPIVRHIASSLTFEEFLDFHNVSILETNENMKSIVDENQVEIGPFSSIQYDGFLRLNIDIRDAESYSDAKIFSRDIHASKLKLERLFGRNAFKLDTVIGSNHRLDASPNLNIEQLSSILTFHHFIDSKNLTMTCLTLYQIQNQFHIFGFKIICYVDVLRGKSIEECSSQIKDRLEITKMTERHLESLFDSMHFVPSTEISEIHSISDIDSTFFHIIDAKAGSIEGHNQLQSTFNSAQFKGKKCLGTYNPNTHIWSIESYNDEDKKGILKERKKIIGLQDAYALSGWKITGGSQPRWKRIPKIDNEKILSDVRLLTSSYFVNDQTTILDDDSRVKSRMRIIDPMYIKLGLGKSWDKFGGKFISFEMQTLSVSEAPPYNVTWRPGGGIWLEVLSEILIWELFFDSDKVQILYEPRISLLKNAAKFYTPEGVAQLSDGTHIVWEVKSVPTTLPRWKNFITQICEYGNLAPYRNTIPVIIHCDENPDQTTLNLAKKSRVILIPWWEIPELGIKIIEWCDDNGVSISGEIRAPNRETEPVKRGEIITEFGIETRNPFVHPTKKQITEWYTSLSEEDVQKFDSDPWNKTLKPHLPKIKNERVPIEKETTDSPVIEEEPPIIEDSNQMKDFILSQTPCAHKDLVLKLKLVENKKMIYGNKSLRQFLLKDMRDLVNVEGENNEMYIYPIREEE